MTARIVRLRLQCANPACNKTFVRKHEYGQDKSKWQKFCSNECRQAVGRKDRGAKMSSMNRRRKWRGRLPELTREDMDKLVAASGVAVTRCPLGAHLGWAPRWMR